MTNQVREIKGDWLGEHYQVRDLTPRRILVSVLDGPNGRLQDAENGICCWAERWPDNQEFITNGVWNFSPDAGELARCGIVPASDDATRSACSAWADKQFA